MKKILISAMLVGIIGFGTGVMLAAPGDESDPVVTLSYIESVLMPSVTKQIEQSQAFQVVNVGQDKRVICEAGTELVLRMGKATVISSEKGGLADITSGVDLQNGSAVPLNSLLIVPLSDGRGVVTQSDVILMIKGKYTVED
ncbi:MAG: hypothetical protein BWY15_01864 [Firmicutes bacterium ADurb.Bin193]|nr:MAG: hypothetical protein BWY15_01864 [Firmicutes bacterium ADurb.Bin193]